MQGLKCMITKRLALEVLTPAHAEVLFPGLSDKRLYKFIDVGPPASIEILRRRYERLATQRSPDGSEIWLNWAVREAHNQEYIGFVQATISKNECATVAFLLFRDSWGKGYGKEAVTAMLTELHKIYGILKFRALANPRNRRSRCLLQSLGFDESKTKLSTLQKGTPCGELEYVLHKSPV